MSTNHGDWSKICPDLLRSIFKGVNFKDFHLRLNFFILNVFTQEKIDLPSMELSFLGLEQVDDLDEWDYFIERKDIIKSRQSAVLWIDERTRDYVVAWVYKRNLLFIHKTGDEMWLRNPEGTKCEDMVFKDSLDS